MSENTETPIRKSQPLSSAAPVLRNNAPRIVSGLRMVTMDKVVTPIPGQKYTGLDGKPSVAVPEKIITPPSPATPTVKPPATQ